MTLSFVEKQQKFIEQSIINNYANISGGSEVRNHYFGNYIVSHYQTAWSNDFVSSSYISFIDGVIIITNQKSTSSNYYCIYP